VFSRETVSTQTELRTLVFTGSTPVPILPKFVRIVVNKILSSEPYPNLEAVDPLSSSEKDLERKKVEMAVANKKKLEQMKADTGVDVAGMEEIPETLEEAEIFIGNNIKSTSEIAAQIATNMTLKWNDFSDTAYRRCVNDITTLGMAVVKRDNDGPQLWGPGVCWPRKKNPYP